MSKFTTRPKAKTWMSCLTMLLLLPGLVGCVVVSKQGAASSGAPADMRPVDATAARPQGGRGRAEGRFLHGQNVFAGDRDGEAPGESAPRKPRIIPVSDSLGVAQDQAKQTPSAQGAIERRVVVYTASFSVVVPDIEAAIGQTKALADEFGGWVQEIRDEDITIRVPAAHYEKVVARVEGLGRVTSREIQAEDVTDQYVDLEARLKNALAVRERLQALLQQAKNVKETLAVEAELRRLGEEIERLQGMLQLLKDRVAYSTIAIALERVSRTEPTIRLLQLPFDWLRDLDPVRLTENY